MIDNNNIPFVKDVVHSIASDFSKGLCKPTFVSEDSETASLLQYFKQGVTISLYSSPLFNRLRIISNGEMIYFAYFYPLLKKSFIISADHRIFDGELIVLLSEWFEKASF